MIINRLFNNLSNYYFLNNIDVDNLTDPKKFKKITYPEIIFKKSNN